MYYQAELGAPRSDNLQLVTIGFGPPANNDAIVRDAIQAIEQLQLPGGEGVLFDGPVSVPVAMALAHAVAHLYQFVAMFDPKLARFVVVISHTPDHRPGDLIE